MAEKEFSGRVALVTGGARGIGRAVSLALAERGARVAVNYLTSKEAAQETLREIRARGSDGIAVPGDVSVPDATAALVEQVARTWGPVDFLVNNAGVGLLAYHDKLTLEMWRKTIDVNLTGAFNMIWAVKDSMLARRFGRIVNMASISGLAPRPWLMPYAASKAGLISLTKSCAAAFAPHIRVNAVAPGLVQTEMLDGAPADLVERLIQETPLKRVGTPEEIAKLVVFLLSEDSSFTTGQTWLADGGRMMMP